MTGRGGGVRRVLGLAVLSAATAAGIAATLGYLFGILPARVARRMNPVGSPSPYAISDRALALHRTLLVVDLHCDALLWGRDLGRRSPDGHLDVPRMIDGGIALEGLAMPTKVPRRLELDRNDDSTDDVILLALLQRWPRATWGSLLARAVYQAERVRAMAAASGGRLTIVAGRGDLATYFERRRVDPDLAAVFLAIEGAHALDGDPANVEVLAEAGYRMMSPTHFFDTAFGGSAHGLGKGGLTAAGREMVARMEARGMIVDVAHASPRTIDDVLAIATRPVVASHTGVRASFDSIRNLSDAHVRGIAATGGLIGIGFWPTATGGDDVASIVRAIRAAAELVGVEHVGLGSDFDGAVPVPFDAGGMPLLTEALMADGFGDAEIAAIMGGNALRVLGATLPEA